MDGRTAPAMPELMGALVDVNAYGHRGNREDGRMVEVDGASGKRRYAVANPAVNGVRCVADAGR